jgi:hypothetical protein
MVRVLLAHDDENVMVAEQIARSRRVAAQIASSEKGI